MNRVTLFLRRAFVLPIVAYRKFISPLKKPSCRFTPTCSQYALEAIMKRGIFIGSFLAVKRIIKCNPFGPFGYDPVPEAKPKKTKRK